jgi:histidine ammonia-lyase
VTGRLSLEDLLRWAREPWPLTLDDDERVAIEANARTAEEASSRGEAYGRTTGVGANRDTSVDLADVEHGLRLVRSHAAGAGDDLGEVIGRATMLVRATQLSRPGSGIPVEVVDALVRAANDGRSPVVRRYGGVGTGDITVLGELGLCLLGERPWRDGSPEAYLDSIGANAALALMSSSAPTLAIAGLGVGEVDTIARASIVVAALSAVAVRANGQQWSEVAESARPSPGVSTSACTMRAVIEGTPVRAARTQDPFGWRAAPYVHGPLLDALAEAGREVEACINADVENPRFADGQVWHHGAFHLTSLSLRLDALRLAVVQWATLSLSRLVKLHDPAYTGAGRFLAIGPVGSSGTMVLEYTSASALDAVRGLADPVSRGTTHISIGTEDHAPWAWRAAQLTAALADPFRTVVACELVSAVRALRMAPGATYGPGVREALEACRPLPDGSGDRPLIEDVAMAADLLPALTPLTTVGGVLTER